VNTVAAAAAEHMVVEPDSRAVPMLADVAGFVTRFVIDSSSGIGG
jgi:hypothetical protein